MIDIKLIRENPEIVKENIRRKFQNSKIPLVDEVRKLDEEWRELKSNADDLRHGRNTISEQINQAKKDKDEKKAKEFLKLLTKKYKKVEKEAKEGKDSQHYYNWFSRAMKIGIPEDPGFTCDYNGVVYTIVELSLEE